MAQETIHIFGGPEKPCMALDSADHIRIFIVHLTRLYLLTPMALLGRSKYIRFARSLQVYKKQITQPQRIVNYRGYKVIKPFPANFLNQLFQNHKPDIAVNHPAADGMYKGFFHQ